MGKKTITFLKIDIEIKPSVLSSSEGYILEYGLIAIKMSLEYGRAESL